MERKVDEFNQKREWIRIEKGEIRKNRK